MPETVGTFNVDLVGVMPRCRDCRFWVEHGANLGTCDRISDGQPAAQAWVEGDAKSFVMTRADFGCVGFEKRDGEVPHD